MLILQRKVLHEAKEYFTHHELPMAPCFAGVMSIAIGTRQYTHNDTASWPATSPHEGKFGSAL